MPLAGISGAGGGAAGLDRHSPLGPRPPQRALGRRSVETGHGAGGCGERTVGESGVCWARIDCLWPARRLDRWRWLLPSPAERKATSAVGSGRGKQAVLTFAASITSNSTSSPSPTLRRNFLGLFLLMAVYREIGTTKKKKRNYSSTKS